MFNNRTKQDIIVGIVEEWEKTDLEVKVNVKLNPDVPDFLVEAIQKNPKCLRIIEQLMPPENVEIIPTRPSLIVPGG